MTGIILGVLGLIATIFLGYYGIILTKKTKQISSLSIKRNECFSLFNSAIRNLKIEIKYSESKVENPLILFKGEIKNTGTLDIDKTSIHETLKLIASENYNWLEVNLINENSKINSTIEKVSDKVISFSWDLLKKKETIQFEALIESNVKENEIKLTEALDFYNSLEFSYRITNLDTILCEDKVDLTKELRKEISADIIVLIISLIIGFTFYFSNYTFNKIPFLRTSDLVELNYKISTNKNDSSFISTIIPISKNVLLLENLKKDNINISVSEFKKNYKIVDISSTNESSFAKTFKVFGGIIALIGILNLIPSILGYKRKQKKPNR